MDELTVEIYGLSLHEDDALSRLKGDILSILELPKAKYKVALKKLASVKEQYPEVPFISFLELFLEEQRETKRVSAEIGTVRTAVS